MRIISGSARGKKLAEFCGKNIRPTPDRVREALFSILNSRLGSFSGLHVLELFAGSGAQSLEAISRGAKSAVLVDSSQQAVATIDENAQRCQCTEQLQVICADALQTLTQLSEAAPFDLILFDPPYKTGLAAQVLEKIESLQLLSEDGIICAETARDEPLPGTAKLELLTSRRYGATQIHLFALAEHMES